MQRDPAEQTEKWKQQMENNNNTKYKQFSILNNNERSIREPDRYSINSCAQKSKLALYYLNHLNKWLPNITAWWHTDELQNVARCCTGKRKNNYKNIFKITFLKKEKTERKGKQILNVMSW